MERESILMYRSTRDMLLDMKKEDKEQYLLALEMYMNYAFDGTEPDLNGQPLVIKLFWKAAKPLIDANNKNYVNGCKGGAPKGNKNNSGGKNQYSGKRSTEGQPMDNPRSTHGQGNVNDNANVTVNATVNAHVNDNANENVNVNVNKEKNPFISIAENGEEFITDVRQYNEWNREHGIEEEA